MNHKVLETEDDKLHLVISDENVREIEVDDRDDGDDSEPYATPPRC